MKLTLKRKIEYFDKFLELKPDFAGAWNLRGLEFVLLKRYEDAIASFDKALEIRPSYPEAKYNREDAETELRKIRAAEGKTREEIEEEIEKEEKDKARLLNLNFLFLEFYWKKLNFELYFHYLLLFFYRSFTVLYYLDQFPATITSFPY